MKKFGIVIICVVLVCVLFGTSVPSYARIKSSVEGVQGNVSDVTTDFTSFSLLLDVVERVFDDRPGDLALEYVSLEDGKYVVLSDASKNIDGEWVASYYLGSGDTVSYDNYKNVIRPSVVLVKANNFFDGLTFGDNFLKNVTALVGYLFVSIIFVLSILIAVVFLMLDSIGVVKALVFAALRIIGLLPV